MKRAGHAAADQDCVHTIPETSWYEFIFTETKKIPTSVIKPNTVLLHYYWLQQHAYRFSVFNQYF